VVGCDDDARNESIEVNSKARFGKHAKLSVPTTSVMAASVNLYIVIRTAKGD
jgi:hypothetical protein